MSRLPRNSAVSGWRLFGLGAALGLALVLGACAEVEEQGDKPIQVEIPAAAPRTLGVETPASAENQKMIALFGGEYHDPAAEQFVNGILLKLAKAGDDPEQPYTGDDPQFADRQRLRHAAGPYLCDARPSGAGQRCFRSRRGYGA